MSVIIRLQGLPWSASAMNIRHFFTGLSIPAGGVHIIGGEGGDAFIAFASDDDARMAMKMNMSPLSGVPIHLFLSSKSEMQSVIDAARSGSVPATNTTSPAVSATGTPTGMQAPMTHMQMPQQQQQQKPQFPNVLGNYPMDNQQSGSPNNFMNSNVSDTGLMQGPPVSNTQNQWQGYYGGHSGNQSMGGQYPDQQMQQGMNQRENMGPYGMSQSNTSQFREGNYMGGQMGADSGMGQMRNQNMMHQGMMNPQQGFMQNRPNIGMKQDEISNMQGGGRGTDSLTNYGNMNDKREGTSMPERSWSNPPQDDMRSVGMQGQMYMAGNRGSFDDRQNTAMSDQYPGINFSDHRVHGQMAEDKSSNGSIGGNRMDSRPPMSNMQNFGMADKPPLEGNRLMNQVMGEKTPMEGYGRMTNQMMGDRGMESNEKLHSQDFGRQQWDMRSGRLDPSFNRFSDSMNVPEKRLSMERPTSVGRENSFGQVPPGPYSRTDQNTGRTAQATSESLMSINDPYVSGKDVKPEEKFTDDSLSKMPSKRIRPSRFTDHIGESSEDATPSTRYPPEDDMELDSQVPSSSGTGDKGISSNERQASTDRMPPGGSKSVPGMDRNLYPGDSRFPLPDKSFPPDGPVSREQALRGDRKDFMENKDYGRPNDNFPSNDQRLPFEGRRYPLDGRFGMEEQPRHLGEFSDRRPGEIYPPGDRRLDNIRHSQFERDFSETDRDRREDIHGGIRPDRSDGFGEEGFSSGRQPFRGRELENQRLHNMAGPEEGPPHRDPFRNASGERDMQIHPRGGKGQTEETHMHTGMTEEAMDMDQRVNTRGPRPLMGENTFDYGPPPGRGRPGDFRGRQQDEYIEHPPGRGRRPGDFGMHPAGGPGKVHGEYGEYPERDFEEHPLGRGRPPGSMGPDFKSGRGRAQGNFDDYPPGRGRPLEDFRDHVPGRDRHPGEFGEYKYNRSRQHEDFGEHPEGRAWPHDEYSDYPPYDDHPSVRGRFDDEFAERPPGRGRFQTDFEHSPGRGRGQQTDFSELPPGRGRPMDDFRDHPSGRGRAQGDFGELPPGRGRPYGDFGDTLPGRGRPYSDFGKQPPGISRPHGDFGDIPPGRGRPQGDFGELPPGRGRAQGDFPSGRGRAPGELGDFPPGRGRSQGDFGDFPPGRARPQGDLADSSPGKGRAQSLFSDHPPGRGRGHVDFGDQITGRGKPKDEFGDHLDHDSRFVGRGSMECGRGRGDLFPGRGRGGPPFGRGGGRGIDVDQRSEEPGSEKRPIDIDVRSENRPGQQAANDQNEKKNESVGAVRSKGLLGDAPKDVSIEKKGPEAKTSQVEASKRDMDNRSSRRNDGDRDYNDRRDKDRDYRSTERRSRDKDRERDRYDRDRRRSRSPDRSRDKSKDRDRRYRWDRESSRRDRDSPRRSSRCVMMKNMPTSVSYKDVRNFFKPIDVPTDGIKVMNDTQGRRTGEAYVRFARSEDASRAVRRSGDKVDGKSVNVSYCSDEDFEKAMESLKPQLKKETTSTKITEPVKEVAQVNPKPNEVKSYIVQLYNLPTNIQKPGVSQFFGVLNIANNGQAIYINHNEKAIPTGKGFVEFSFEVDYKKALTYNLNKIGNNVIRVTPGKKEDLNELIQKAKTQTNPGSSPAGNAVSNAPRPPGFISNTLRPLGIVSNTPRPQGAVPNAPRPQGVVSNAPRPQGVVSNAPRPQGVVSNAPRPQGVVSNAPRPQGVVSNAPGPQGVVSNAPRPQGVISNALRPQGVTSNDLRPQGIISNTPRPQGGLLGHRPNEVPANPSNVPNQGSNIRGPAPLSSSNGGGDNSQQGTETVCVHIQGLPLLATPQDIREFFSDCQIAMRGINIAYDSRGKPLGEGFVEFKFKADFDKALKKSKTKMGRHIVAVKAIGKKEMINRLENARGQGNSAQPKGNNMETQSAMGDDKRPSPSPTVLGGDNQLNKELNRSPQTIPCGLLSNPIPPPLGLGKQEPPANAQNTSSTPQQNKQQQSQNQSAEKPTSQQQPTPSQQKQSPAKQQQPPQQQQQKPPQQQQPPPKEQIQQSQPQKPPQQSQPFQGPNVPRLQPGGSKSIPPGVLNNSWYYVRCQNFPPDITIAEIMHFFQGFRPIGDSIRLHYSSEGKPTGNAVVGFTTGTEAQAALKRLNMRPCRRNMVSLFPA